MLSQQLDFREGSIGHMARLHGSIEARFGQRSIVMLTNRA